MLRNHVGLLLIVLVSFGVVFLLPLRPVSAAPVLVENFNGDSFDHSIWQTLVLGTGPSVTVANQSLIVNLPPNSLDDPTRSVFGAALVSGCTLQGDFDMQVGFQLEAWPSYNGVRTGLGSVFQLYGSGSEYSNHYAIERDSFALTRDFPNNQSYVTDLLDGVQGFVPANDLGGMLRVTRSGSTATGYYLNAGNWLTVHSGPMTTTNVGFGFGAWSHNYAFSQQQVKVSFTNFTLTSGRLDCPTLTASPPTGPIGTQVTVTGIRFPLPPANYDAPSVEVTFDDMFLGSTTNNGGSFAFTFDVPTAQPGIHEIKATDFSTGTNATTTFRVILARSPLSVSLSVGTVYFPGDTVVASVLVTSAGMPLSSSGLQLHLNLTRADFSNIALNVTSIGSGLFRASYSLPKTAQIGTYSLLASANIPALGSGSALGTFEVKLPWLSSQGSTAAIAGVASVATIGVALVSWRKGYFKRSTTIPF